MLRPSICPVSQSVELERFGSVRIVYFPKAVYLRIAAVRHLSVVRKYYFDRNYEQEAGGTQHMHYKNHKPNTHTRTLQDSSKI